MLCIIIIYIFEYNFKICIFFFKKINHKLNIKAIIKSMRHITTEMHVLQVENHCSKKKLIFLFPSTFIHAIE